MNRTQVDNNSTDKCIIDKNLKIQLYTSTFSQLSTIINNQLTLRPILITETIN